MDGLINEKKLTVVKEYKFDNPIIQNIDSIINKRYRGCYHKHFHTFEYECIYDLNFTKDTNFTISDKNLGMYELNKKLYIARQRGFIFNHINKLTIKIYSNLSNINIHYHLKLDASPLHRQLFRKLACNHDYIQTHCNDRNNPFQFACRQWYSYNNPGIHTRIHIQILKYL